MQYNNKIHWGVSPLREFAPRDLRRYLSTFRRTARIIDKVIAVISPCPAKSVRVYPAPRFVSSCALLLEPFNGLDRGGFLARKIIQMDHWTGVKYITVG